MKFTRKALLTLSAVALSLAAPLASAMEVKPGDQFSALEVLKLLTSKVYNLTDPLCIQKTVLQSPQHQAHIAVGATLGRVELGHYIEGGQTTVLVIHGTYFYQQVPSAEDTQLLGTCRLQE